MMQNRNQNNVSTRLPLPAHDVQKASRIETTSETATLASGLAGATGSVILSFAPVASSKGDLVGKKGDSSLTFSDVLTTEVAFAEVSRRAVASGYAGGVSPNEPAIDYTQFLINGEYYVVYETGLVYYKKAGAGVSATASYKYRANTVQTVVGDKVGHDITGINSGRKVVATSGTAEPIVASTTVAKIAVIQAELDNNGVVVVGGTNVVASGIARQGYALEAGDAIAVPCDDLQDIYIDATENGEGVTFVYYV